MFKIAASIGLTEVRILIFSIATTTLVNVYVDLLVFTRIAGTS